jgi:enoyl-[acyl-carrier-protein] reductase (NADH)
MGLFSAVVTGGASGIGTAVARKLASRGIAVLIADVQVEKGQSLVKEIRTKYKTPAEFVRTDVSQESDVQKMVQTAVDSWGRLDYAANCAGICEKIFDEEETVSAELVDRSVLIPGEAQVLPSCRWSSFSFLVMMCMRRHIAPAPRLLCCRVLFLPPQTADMLPLLLVTEPTGSTSEGCGYARSTRLSR